MDQRQQRITDGRVTKTWRTGQTGLLCNARKRRCYWCVLGWRWVPSQELKRCDCYGHPATMTWNPYVSVTIPTIGGLRIQHLLSYWLSPMGPIRLAAPPWGHVLADGNGLCSHACSAVCHPHQRGRFCKCIEFLGKKQARKKEAPISTHT